MNPRPLLWLLLAGCADSKVTKAPEPACPLGHRVVPSVRLRYPVEGREGWYSSREATEEEMRNGKTNANCSDCDYSYFGEAGVWTREAKSLQGFRFNACILIHALMRELPGCEVQMYTQSHSDKAITEKLYLLSPGDAWPKTLAQVQAFAVTGEIREAERVWTGRFADHEVEVEVRLREGGSRLRVEIHTPRHR